MSIVTALNNAREKIENAYTALEAKGGVLPETQNLTNLANTINTIPSSERKYGMTTNDLIGSVNENGNLQYPGETEELVFNDIVCIKDPYMLAYKFYHNSAVTSVSFPDLVSVHSNYALDNTFANCSSLVNVNMNCLTNIYGSGTLRGTFASCQELETIRFPMLQYVTTPDSWTTTTLGSDMSLEEIHFRKDMEDKVKGWTGYKDVGAWGSSDARVIFDIVGTITSNGVSYSRSEQDSTTNEDVEYTGWIHGTIIDNDRKEYVRLNSRDYYTNKSSISGVVYCWYNSIDDVYAYTTERTPTSTSTLWDNNGYPISEGLREVNIDIVYTLANAEPEVGDDIYDEDFRESGTVESIA